MWVLDRNKLLDLKERKIFWQIFSEKKNKKEEDEEEGEEGEEGEEEEEI